MNLKEYFEKTEGTGVLATADADGRVDVALYARPHVIEDNTVAFIMRERLSHHNLRSNPQAAYLFIEKGPGYKGKRIYLTMLREETNTDLIKQLVRKEHGMDNPKDDANRYLVFFQVDKERPLIGDHHV
jgi:hypothetical protein